MSYNEPSSGSAPSTVYAPPEEASSWPTIWGLVGSIWAVMVGLLMACGTLWQLWWGPKFQASMTNTDLQPVPGVVTGVMSFDLLLTLVLCGMLLMGSIALTKRRPKARKLINLYVGARVAVAPILLGLGLLIARPTWEMQQEGIRAQIEVMEKNNGAKSVPQFMRDMANETEPPFYQYAIIVAFSVLSLAPAAVAWVVVNGKSRRAEIESWQQV